MSRLTLMITARILFGAEGDAVAAEIGGALEAATSLLEVAVLPFAALIDLLPLPHVRRFRAARATLDRVDDAPHRTQAARWKRRTGMSCRCCCRRSDEGTGERMSDSQVRDEVITLLLASHETTANALAWTWYLLARHARDEARMHAEIDAVLGDRPPSDRRRCPDLPFTRMVLAESMRLYPPAWLLARVAVENHEARGYVVP